MTPSRSVYFCPRCNSTLNLTMGYCLACFWPWRVN